MRLSILIVLSLALLPRLASASAPKIPIRDFFADPVVMHCRLSPDGKRVAFLASMEGRVGLALMDLESGKVEKAVRTEENLDGFLWKSDEHIIFTADVGGNEAQAVQSLNIRTRRITRLLESYGENNYLRQSGNFGSVVSYWKSNPRKIVVHGSREASSWTAGFYAVDITTGRRSSLDAYVSEKDAILDRVLDHSGRVRVRVRHDSDKLAVEARLGDSLRYTTLFTQPADIQLGGLPEATILADNRTLLFVDFARHDRGTLVAWDLNTGRFQEELFTPPAGEITRLIIPRDGKVLLGVEYEADRTGFHWFDEGFRALQASLDQSLPDTTNMILDWSDDRKKFVISSSSDREAGVYLLLDRSRAKPLLMPLGSVRPNLDSKQLAPMQVVRFPARDGFELQAHLTRPLGRTDAGPMVLIPHGGPYGIRDSWGYDGEVQFLANRGFAVLQVNYRGSGGFGRRYLEAGRLEWGKKMQDDLTDAVKWAIAQGIADPKRVAIYGASYGGYAAMAGAAFTPDLYRCAVNFVGAVDLTFLGRRDLDPDPVYIQLFYGSWIHPDMDELRRRSPVNHVAAIKVPTMHAYGENDPRVEIRHWRKLKAELDKHGKTYEFLREGDEGHGFDNTEARIRFYAALESFLGRHLEVK